MQKLPVFGDQQKQHTVDDAQNLLVKFLRGQPTGAQFFEQNSVGAIGDESRPQNGDGLFDSGIKVVEGAEGFVLGRFFPAFQPVLLGLFALETGLVADKPQDEELGIEVAIEHGLKVELDEGQTGESDIVAEQAQIETVGHDAPKVRFAGVQRRLDQRVWAGFGRANGTGRPVVEVRVGTDQVDGHLIPAVGNRIAVAIHFNGLCRRQTTKTEFLKEREQPAFARIGGGGITGGFSAMAFLKFSQQPLRRFQLRLICSFNRSPSAR